MTSNDSAPGSTISNSSWWSTTRPTPCPASIPGSIRSRRWPARRSHRAAAGLPSPIIDLHPDRPDQRGGLTPSGATPAADEPTFEAIEAAGGVVERNADVHAVAGLFVGSGLIERQTSYETGLAGHHTRRGDEWYEDPLILDERFLAARVRGRGVSVLSACSHAGIVNACLSAQSLFPDEPIDTVLGGYHFAAGSWSLDPETVRNLLTASPLGFRPGHCTGWRAGRAGPRVRPSVRPERGRPRYPSPPSSPGWADEPRLVELSDRGGEGRGSTTAP